MRFKREGIRARRSGLCSLHLSIIMVRVTGRGAFMIHLIFLEGGGKNHCKRCLSTVRIAKAINLLLLGFYGMGGPYM